MRVKKLTIWLGEEISSEKRSVQPETDISKNLRTSECQMQKGGKMIKGTIIMVVGIMVGLLYAQAPDTLWTKHYGGPLDDRGFSIQQTLDGGYIISGKYHVVVTNEDVNLLKLDSIGNFVWEQFFGGVNSEGGFSVQQTSDSGYVIAGYTNSTGAGGYDFYLVKTDSLGNSLGARTYGGVGDEYCYSVQQTPDKGYILVGSTTSYGAGSSDVYLVKTSQTGNIQWDTTYGGTEADVGYCVDQTADGGYIVVGSAYSPSNYDDVYLIKTDASGNVLGDSTYGGALGDWGYSVQQTLDQGYIIAGTTVSFGANNVYLIKTDFFGQVQWDNVYGSGNNFDKGYSVEQTSDSGYVVAGYTWDGVSSTFDLYIVKTNSLGDIQWTKTVPAFGGFSGEDYRFSIKETSDSGYVVAGWTNNIYGSDDDIFVVRLAPYLALPMISVSPTYFNVIVNVGEDTTRTLNICNTGYAALDWDIAENVPVAWLSEDPISGSVAPSDTDYVTITFDATSLAQGDYYDTLLVTSNDPITPEVRVPIHLTVNVQGIEETGSIALKDECEVQPFFNNAIALTFTKPADSPLEISLYNVLGRMVDKTSIPTTPSQLNLTNKNIERLADGVYFLSISRLGNTYPVMKVIKINN